MTEDEFDATFDDEVIFESRAVYLCREGKVKEVFNLDEMRDIRRRGHTCIVWNYADNSFESHIAILDFQRDNWLDALDKAQSGKYAEILYA